MNFWQFFDKHEGLAFVAILAMAFTVQVCVQAVAKAFRKRAIKPDEAEEDTK